MPTQRQKISLGRGLVRSDVAAILFDEPLTVIDPHLKWQLRRKLKEIHERFHTTMIYVTHDQVEAMTFADQIVVMYEGEVVQVGTPQELFEKPGHKFVGYFIGSPGMNFLPCRVAASKWMAWPARLDDRSADLAAKAQGLLELGIRPMHLEVNLEAVESALPADVKTVEDRGSCKIVTLSLGVHIMRAQLPEEQPPPQQKAWLRFPPQWTRLFVLTGRLVG